ncbi:terminase large subunit domain-containing protein [Polyangium aurulentum]|uniref:terminase large subunit domain-containing protein n=1 Tax=Polyangium aurulentum TaxID=2567896 RepID=UPI0010AEB7A9|nr:terminase family protein [Polyangium aurulentum]
MAAPFDARAAVFVAAQRSRVATAPAGGLADFIPAVTPGHERPTHLGPLVELLERARREPVRAVIHAPPRHGKTDTVLHAIAWFLRNDPSMAIAYATYGIELANSKSRDARGIARASGVELDPGAKSVGEWRTREGGRAVFTALNGALTGKGFQILFVDDPFKNRIQAESVTYRARIWDLWQGSTINRVEPGGSAIVLATRWHPEDLSGRLIAQGWQYLRLPALSDDGKALWPERWPAEELELRRREVGEYTWASLYQGVPRPRGGAVFNTEPALYTDHALELVTGYRNGIGVDFAYTARKHADYSSAVAMRSHEPERGRRVYYVLECLRRQVMAPEFAAEGARLQKAHGGCRAMGYVTVFEKMIVPFMADRGFMVEARRAKADKFTRAQPYAASWNDGRVLLPADVGPDSWVNVFLAEHLSFTGQEDEHDDQVDAGAAAHDLLSSPAGRTAGSFSSANARPVKLRRYSR